MKGVFRRAPKFLPPFFLAGGVALSEIIFFQQANYIFTNVVNLLLSIGIFFSLSAGALLGLGWRKLRDPWAPLLSSAFFTAGLLGIILAPRLGMLWVLLSFLGYGFAFTRFFARLHLARLVPAIGLGSVLVYALLHPLYALAGNKVLLVACAWPLLGLLSRKATRAPLLAGAAFAASLALLFHAGAFQATSYAEREIPGLQGASRVAPTHFDPLILTDLIHAPVINRHVILTNGSRFSSIVKESDFTEVTRRVFRPSFSIPYLFHKPRKVLVIGPAGGVNVLAAMNHGASEIVAVDINPRVFEIMAGPMKEESQGIYLDPRVRTVAAEGRHFLETTREIFDLIVVQGVQTGTANNIVNTAVLEGFLFTKEALARMWSRLNPGGMIFIEEYAFFQDDRKRELSYLSNLAVQLAEITDQPESHFALFKFRQATANPKANEVRREALLAAQRPLVDPAGVVARKWPEGEVSQKAWNRSGKSAVSVTDNSPFFIKRELARHEPLLAGFALLLLAGVLFLCTRQRPATLAWGYGAITFQGMGFICLVMAMLGPATLLIGPPQLATPVVYFALFLFSMIGGLLALRLRDNAGPYAAVALVLVILPLAFPALKATVLSLESLPTRVALVAALVGLAALLTELPYIVLLNRYRARDRARLFVFGKIGVFAGVPFGILSQLNFGFSGCLAASLIFYALAYLTEARVPALKEKAP